MDSKRDKKYPIYGLFSPDNEEIKYVGLTSGSLKERLRSHIYAATKLKDKLNYHSLKNEWIRNVLDNDFSISIKKLADAMYVEFYT
jgi:hypothetical protein